MNWGNARNEPVSQSAGLPVVWSTNHGSGHRASAGCDQRHGRRDDQRHSRHHVPASPRPPVRGLSIGCNEREHVDAIVIGGRVMVWRRRRASCADAATPSRSSNAPNLTRRVVGLGRDHRGDAAR